MSEDDAKKGFVFNKLGALFDKMFEKRNVLQRNALQTWRDETIMTKALQKREQRIKGDVVKAFKKNVDVKRDAKRRQIIPAFLDNIFGNNEEKKDLSYEQFYNMNKKKKEQESMTERMRIFSDKIREKLLEEKKEGSVIYSDDELEKIKEKKILMIIKT